MVPVSSRLAPRGPPGRFLGDFGAKPTGSLSPPPTSSGGIGSLFCTALDFPPNSPVGSPESFPTLGLRTRGPLFQQDSWIEMLSPLCSLVRGP